MLRKSTLAIAVLLGLSTFPIYVVYLKQFLHVPSDIVGGFICAASLGGALSLLFWGKLADTIGYFDTEEENRRVFETGRGTVEKGGQSFDPSTPVLPVRGLQGLAQTDGGDSEMKRGLRPMVADQDELFPQGLHAPEENLAVNGCVEVRCRGGSRPHLPFPGQKAVDEETGAFPRKIVPDRPVPIGKGDLGKEVKLVAGGTDGKGFTEGAEEARPDLPEGIGAGGLLSFLSHR